MPNPCGLCRATCCKDYVITVTSFDVARIIERTGMEFWEFAALEPLRLISYDNNTVLECYEKNGRGALRYDYVLAFKSHPCVFLEKDRCLIYAFAPPVCRLYPYNSLGKMLKGARCPVLSNALFRLKGSEEGKKEYRNQIVAYGKLVAEWNGKKGNKKDCIKFLLGRSKGKK